MVLDNDRIQRRYGHLAPVYDALLHLRRGDTVLDIGCGTGLNFPMLHEAVGPEERIIGVDLSSAMLAKAQERLVRARFSNVDLIQADMARDAMPSGIAGAVATYTLEMIPATMLSSEELPPFCLLAVVSRATPSVTWLSAESD